MQKNAESVLPLQAQPRNPAKAPWLVLILPGGAANADEVRLRHDEGAAYTLFCVKDGQEQWFPLVMHEEDYRSGSMLGDELLAWVDAQLPLGLTANRMAQPVSGMIVNLNTLKIRAPGQEDVTALVGPRLPLLHGAIVVHGVSGELVRTSRGLRVVERIVGNYDPSGPYGRDDISIYIMPPAPRWPMTVRELADHCLGTEQVARTLSEGGVCPDSDCLVYPHDLRARKPGTARILHLMNADAPHAHAATIQRSPEGTYALCTFFHADPYDRVNFDYAEKLDFIEVLGPEKLDELLQSPMTVREFMQRTEAAFHLPRWARASQLCMQLDDVIDLKNMTWYPGAAGEGWENPGVRIDKGEQLR